MKALILIALMLTSICSFAQSTRDGYIIKNVAVATNTTTITSNIITLDKNLKVGIHTKLADGGAATGTVITYLSNDMVNSGRSVSNWVIYNSTAISAAGEILSNFTDISAKWLKVVFSKSTNAAATGTVSSIIYVQ